MGSAAIRPQVLEQFAVDGAETRWVSPWYGRPALNNFIRVLAADSSRPTTNRATTTEIQSSFDAAKGFGASSTSVTATRRNCCR